MTHHIQTRIERYTINLSKGRCSRWHVDGPWPTAAYFLFGPKEDRFADEGDTVECVVLKVMTWEYNGLRYVTSQPQTELMLDITAPSGPGGGPKTP
jgi:hypothetical protein